MEEVRSTIKIITDKPTSRRHLGSPRSKCEDNVRMNIKEIGISTRNWVDSDLDMDYWRVFGTSGFHKPWS